MVVPFLPPAPPPLLATLPEVPAEKSEQPPALLHPLRPAAAIPPPAASPQPLTEAAALGAPQSIGWQQVPGLSPGEGSPAGASVSPEPAQDRPPAIPPLAQSSTPPTTAPLPQRPPTPRPGPPGQVIPIPPDPASALPNDGARPEPHWHNGGITPGGQLLGPTRPTNTPEIPVDLQAEFQALDVETQVVTARGNVRLRVGNALLEADRLWVNLANRFVLATGNVIFQRGNQRITGDRLEYNLLQGSGTVTQARGEVFLPTLGQDIETIIPVDASQAANQPITERLRNPGPIAGVRTVGSAIIGLGPNTPFPGTREPVGSPDLQRFRFQADRIDLDAVGWQAEGIRFTTDPFSPPELEFRGSRARLEPLPNGEDELVVDQARVVFDQGLSVPLVRSRVRLRRDGFDEEDLNPLPTGLGIDGRDRGGFFVERSFTLGVAPPWRLEVVPQVLVERLLSSTSAFNLSNYGAIVNLTGQFGPTTRVLATANLSGLDLQNFDTRLRSSVRVQQALSRHTLNLEYSYRDRLFNGSLGFQEVQNSVGAVLVSPGLVLGNTGITFNYQLGAQYITAETDRPALLVNNLTNNFASLGRFQGVAALGRGFTLWQGQPLPPTPEAGLRFTPRPVVPFVDLVLGVQGAYSYYTDGSTQENLNASVGLRGQFGRFSRNFFDYTQWNISYSKSFVGTSTSPFRFDRNVDQNILNFGLIQQLYGPIRVGFQSSLNLDTGVVFSTDYILEYSRRTYGFVLQINPQQSRGFVGFRLSFFDWIGDSGSFGPAGVRSVRQGVIDAVSGMPPS